MSRLSEELRNRTKAFASEVIRFYIRLPKGREEVSFWGNSCFAQALQSLPMLVRLCGRDQMLSFALNLTDFSRRRMKANFGWNYWRRIVVFPMKRTVICRWSLTN